MTKSEIYATVLTICWFAVPYQEVYYVPFILYLAKIGVIIHKFNRTTVENAQTHSETCSFLIASHIDKKNVHTKLAEIACIVTKEWQRTQAVRPKM